MRCGCIQLAYCISNTTLLFRDALKVKSGGLHGDGLRVLERGEKSRCVEICNAIKLDIFKELFNSEVTRQPAETPRHLCSL